MHATLDDRYQLVERIGRGAVAEVWRAEDLATGHPVAIKWATPGDPDAAHAIRREYRARYDLVHPSLVGMRSLGEGAGRPFLVLEWVSGEPLDAWLAGHPDEVRALFRVLRQVAEGLAVLHDRGQVHGDLKPGHVLVRPGGRAVLIDFDLSGLAADLGADDSTAGHTGGTRGYMAPEVLAGAPASPASDRYALGALMWCCLAGHRPPEPDQVPRIPSPPCDQDTAVLALLSTRLLDPRPERRPLLRDILRTLGPDDAAPLDVGACVGRDTLLTDLAAWDARPTGRPLLVHAGSGFGKSTLLREHLRRRQARRPGRTFITRCPPDAWRPHVVLMGWVDALMQVAAQHPPGSATRRDAALLEALLDPSQTLSSESVDAAADTLIRMLARKGRLHPVRLWMDDVQWLEPPATHIVQRLVDARIRGVRLLLSSRTDELGLALPDDTVRVALRGLTADDIRTWAQLKAVDLATLDIEYWVTRTRGSPALMAMLLENISYALTEPFDRRYELLSDAARQALAMICLAGDPLPTRLLAKELGEEVDGAIQALRHQRFVVWERVGGKSALRPILPITVDHTLRLLPADRQAAVRALLARQGVVVRPAGPGSGSTSLREAP